jgi:hypothetical protein
MNPQAMRIRRSTRVDGRIPGHRVFSVTGGCLVLALGGCAPGPTATDRAADLTSSGVVVAARPIPAESPAYAAAAMALGLPRSFPVPPPAVELVVALDAGRAISVIEPVGRHSAPGDRMVLPPSIRPR